MNFVWNEKNKFWNVSYQGQEKKLYLTWNSGVELFFKTYLLNHEKKLDFFKK